MSIGDVDALDQFGRDDLAAIKLQNQALAHQKQGEFETALQLMQESLHLRESSYTTCRSLTYHYEFAAAVAEGVSTAGKHV